MSFISKTSQPNNEHNSSNFGTDLWLHPDVEDTLDDIDAALAAAQLEPPAPTLLRVLYLREQDLFILEISNGRRLAIPREDIWAVHNATRDQAADFVSEPPHTDIWWPQVDEGLLIEDALEGRYGNKAWMDKVHRRTGEEQTPAAA